LLGLQLAVSCQGRTKLVFRARELCYEGIATSSGFLHLSPGLVGTTPQGCKGPICLGCGSRSSNLIFKGFRLLYRAVIYHIQSLNKLRKAVGRIDMVWHSLPELSKTCDDALDIIPHPPKFAMQPSDTSCSILGIARGCRSHRLGMNV
jgi:hypothetical protein